MTISGIDQPSTAITVQKAQLRPTIVPSTRAAIVNRRAASAAVDWAPVGVVPRNRPRSQEGREAATGELSIVELM
ncbi:hypothetical protein METY_2413 [Methylopila sp. Yamaguchi]|nr:hypothetical protein METY_2413 [Methylopila sp. Yamaguchi]